LKSDLFLLNNSIFLVISKLFSVSYFIVWVQHSTKCHHYVVQLKKEKTIEPVNLRSCEISRGFAARSKLVNVCSIPSCGWEHFSPPTLSHQ